MSDKSKVNLIKIVNELQDKLNPLGINNLAFDLPQIAVIGGQSAGKSSVLESFAGMDFLPRGNNIVTRRPLVLQLIYSEDTGNKICGEFLHLPGKQFYDFDDIRDEITAETDREVKDSAGISPKPINLKIYSPDVLDLTLVDLPGMTRVPVGNQPKDIESRIESMILEFIKKENCLILAVSGANQDLATSDAIKLAERVDPEGERTIGVLTKLDRMDDGTDARDILIGKHDIRLKRGFIGVINRSQKDIDSNKSMKDALAQEQKYFQKSPAYKDIADKLGIKYLQNYLHNELSKHILKLLPPLKRQFDDELIEINEKLGKISFPFDSMNKERILSVTNEEFRQRFESSVGGMGWKFDITKLSGGAKINVLMNDTYAKEINKLFYDENRMSREIATAIQNFYGIYLGVFTPDAAFRTVIEHQIELFRNPSLVCVDWVSQEIDEIVRDSVKSIETYASIKEMYTKHTLDFVRDCKKKCKEFIEHFVEGEKAYLNTIHEDFIQLTSIGNIENSTAISEAQLKTSVQVIQTQDKSDYIVLNKKMYWFVLDKGILTWYKDRTKKDKKGSVAVKGAQFKTFTKDNTLVLVFPKKLGIFDKNSEMTLIFNTSENIDKWKDWLEDSGVSPNYGDNESVYYNDDSDTNSVSNISFNNLEQNSRSTEDMASPEYMRGHVEQVKKLVDSYMIILKKKFKDAVPKLCVIEMIDSTLRFIAIDLKVEIRNQISSIDDIINGDPNEELIKDLSLRQKHYSEAIAIIDKYSNV